jgi:hypothetical protein
VVLLFIGQTTIQLLGEKVQFKFNSGKGAKRQAGEANCSEEKQDCSKNEEVQNS